MTLQMWGRVELRVESRVVGVNKQECEILTHLGGAAVVQLDGELLVDGLLVPAGLSELDLLDLVLSGSEAALDGGDGE